MHDTIYFLQPIFLCLHSLTSFLCSLSLVSFKTPAPGAYSPEKVHPQGERYAPAWSCGSRTRYRKRKETMRLQLKPTLQPTMQSPLNIFFLKLSFYFVLGDSTPSPSSYTLPPLLGPKIANKFSSASYSMTARAKTGGFAEDLAKTPGPGNYRTVDPAVYKKKDPAYSMNQRSYMPGGIPLSLHVIFIKI